MNNVGRNAIEFERARAAADRSRRFLVYVTAANADPMIVAEARRQLDSAIGDMIQPARSILHELIGVDRDGPILAATEAAAARIREEFDFSAD